jgi:hypothetical protein
MGKKVHNAFLPAFFAAAQRAFAARERFLLAAALILRFDFCVLIPPKENQTLTQYPSITFARGG